MGEIVMTLLVPRQPEKNAIYPFAVQMTFPIKLRPGEIISLTEVRLIDQSGRRVSAERTLMYYNPEKWQAASFDEQAQYRFLDGGKLQPWYRSSRGSCKSVYDYPGSGDKDTNNGQVWSELENLDSDWEAEREIRQKFQDAVDAERDRRIAKWGEE
jgi:uncharacterized protein with NRDE domain